MDKNGKKQAEFGILFGSILTDIENAKRRQWATIYYVLLSLAAIIGFYYITLSTFHYTCLGQKLLLFLPSLFLSYMGIYHLLDTQKCQCQYRMRLIRTKNEFESETKNLLDISISGNVRYVWWWVAFFLGMMVLLCLLFVAWGYYHKWYNFIWSATLFILVGFIFAFCIKKHQNSARFKRKGIDGEYPQFDYYFWTLVFPFFILIMAGVFYIAWLLFNDDFSPIQVLLLVALAEAICFIPCYLYYKTAVSKTWDELRSDYLSLEAALERAIGILEKEEGPLKEKRKVQLQKLESALSECKQLYEEGKP